MNRKLKRYRVKPSMSEVYAVSLVEEPAVDSTFIALSKQKPMDFNIQNEEQRKLYGVALRADYPIYRKYGDEEFYLLFEKDAIERLVNKFMSNYRQRNFTLDHLQEAEGIVITESWIVKDKFNDKANALGLTDFGEGDWIIGTKINNDETWQSIKEGRWHGFSVETWIDMEEIEDFKKINKENDIKMNKFEEMVDKIKNIILEAVEEPETKVEETVEEEVKEEKFEEEETKTEEVTVEEEVKEENFEEETKPEEEEQTVQEEEKPNEEVVELQKQIEELKKENEDLKKQNEKMSKQPSTKVVTNGNETKRTGLDAVFASLREQGFID